MGNELLSSLREHHCTKDGLPDFPCWWCRCIDEIERLQAEIVRLQAECDAWHNDAVGA